MTYGVFFELYRQDESSTFQWLFIPSIDTKAGMTIPSAWTRTLHKNGNKTPWVMIQDHAYSPEYVTTSSSERSHLIGKGLDQLSGISSHLRQALSDPDLVLRGSVPINISESMATSIHEGYYIIPKILELNIVDLRNTLGWLSTGSNGGKTYSWS